MTRFTTEGSLHEEEQQTSPMTKLYSFSQSDSPLLYFKKIAMMSGLTLGSQESVKSLSHCKKAPTSSLAAHACKD